MQRGLRVITLQGVIKKSQILLLAILFSPTVISSNEQQHPIGLKVISWTNQNLIAKSFNIESFTFVHSSEMEAFSASINKYM